MPPLAAGHEPVTANPDTGSVAADADDVMSPAERNRIVDKMNGMQEGRRGRLQPIEQYGIKDRRTTLVLPTQAHFMQGPALTAHGLSALGTSHAAGELMMVVIVARDMPSGASSSSQGGPIREVGLAVLDADSTAQDGAKLMRHVQDYGKREVWLIGGSDEMIERARAQIEATGNSEIVFACPKFDDEDRHDHIAVDGRGRVFWGDLAHKKVKNREGFNGVIQSLRSLLNDRSAFVASNGSMSMRVLTSRRLPASRFPMGLAVPEPAAPGQGASETGGPAPAPAAENQAQQPEAAAMAAASTITLIQLPD